MSILDQVRKNQFKEQLIGFNPVKTLEVLFSHLTDKERDIVQRRFGLIGSAEQTLEEIGKQYAITRERVRQIQTLTIKKLKELEALRTEINQAEKVAVQLVEQYGGIMEEAFFLENILGYLEDHPNSQSALLFLAEYIFSDNINRIKQDREFNNLWKINSTNVDILKQVVSQMVTLIEAKGKPTKLNEILAEFKQSEFYQGNKDKILAATNFLELTEAEIDKVLENYLRASRLIKQNLFDEWGLISWGSVQPKKINDKIYIVLKKTGKPLHFNAITSLINEAKFDEKIAYAPTVHNELILDNKFILVGRGIYALGDWGYKSGNVAQVVEEVLQENGPLTKNQVIEEVLKRRDVKKSTVYLSLTNNKKIKKTKDNKYILATDSAKEAEKK